MTAPPSQDMHAKARRLLTDGRLQVLRVRPKTGAVVAECQGDHDVYKLGYDPDHGEWRCTCPASSMFHRQCSHLLALLLVVSPNRPSTGQAPDPVDDARLLMDALGGRNANEEVLAALGRLAGRR